MTPAARVQAAIGVLDAWCGGAPVEQVLTNWGRSARYAGSGDRAAVRDLVFDVLRARGRCAALGGAADGAAGGRALMIGLLRLQGVDLETLFTGDRHGPTALTPEERGQSFVDPGPEVDVPGWTLPMLAERAGPDLPELLEHLRHRAPLYLRVNRRLAGRDQVIDSLSADGIVARADDRAPTALEVTQGARRLKASVAFAQGWVEPQDLSVQRALAAVDWPTGRILDYCAGGGGKALAIADTVAACVFAHDAAPGRMADLPQRADRAGVRIDTLDRASVRRAAPFDAVLCDVPCSGSGTWRRDPEAKWRLTPERLAELNDSQAGILDEAAPLVSPGGMLVYMTCSLFHRENEGQIARFLAGHPGWRLEKDGVDTPLCASDGFYHAVLRQRSE